MQNSNQRKTGAVLSYVAIVINTLIQLLYTPLLTLSVKIFGKI